MIVAGLLVLGGFFFLLSQYLSVEEEEISQSQIVIGEETKSQSDESVPLDIEKKTEEVITVVAKHKKNKNIEEQISPESNDDIVKKSLDILDGNNDSVSNPEPKKIWSSADSSVQKFVWPDDSFDDLEYVPTDLVLLEHENIVDTKKSSQLRQEAAGALYDMAEAFYKKFGQELVVVSAYRSYKYQKVIKEMWCSDEFCAKAWHSEHQSGLAVDFWETTTSEEFLSKPNQKVYFEWLLENAYRFGYHNSYQNGREIDGYHKEPWHWRYVWNNLATKLHDNSLTFTQWHSSQKSHE